VHLSPPVTFPDVVLSDASFSGFALSLFSPIIYSIASLPSRLRLQLYPLSTQMGLMQPRFIRLAPAPPKPQPAHTPRVTFLDLPPELRIEIYKLALKHVTVHVLPINCEDARKLPHALTRTTKQVRREVLPLMHALCPIWCSITDFNFDSLREWMKRIPPEQEANLCKNRSLAIRFCTTTAPPKSVESLRKWLHMRADPYRPQPHWQYSGSRPSDKVCKDLVRRAKRMKDASRQKEMFVILECLGVPRDSSPGRPRARAT
jgi:hypothetical protein